MLINAEQKLAKTDTKRLSEVRAALLLQPYQGLSRFIILTDHKGQQCLKTSIYV